MATQNTQAKVALVTGASSGIGKDIAQRLHSEGLIVYAVARRIEKMQDLQQMGVNCLRMDITADADVQNVVDEIIGKHGRIDVLVNNAGYGHYGAVEDVPLDDARYQFEVNLFGLASLTQKVLPIMRKQRAGTIINMSSMGGKIYTPLGAWYHATKHALEGWSDSLRLEVADFGINVVIIEPGAIRTEFGEVMSDQMIRTSGEGAYASLVDRIKAASKRNYENGGGSPASVISDLVSRAVKADRPRTRYAAGQYAKPLMFLRKWLSDRMFDRIVMRVVR